MKNLFSLALAVLLLGLPVGKIMADCTAMEDDPGVNTAHKLRNEASALRDKGDYVTAAMKYEQAGDAMPMEVYAGVYYLNAEGCLVGKYGPDGKGDVMYNINHDKAVKNSKHAKELLDKAQAKLNKANADGCDYANGIIRAWLTWYENAADALQQELAAQ